MPRVAIGIALAVLQTFSELFAQHMQGWAARHKRPVLQAVFAAMQILTGVIELVAFQYAPMSVVIAVGLIGLIGNLATESGLSRRRILATLTIVATSGVAIYLGTSESNDDDAGKTHDAITPLSIGMLAAHIVAFVLLVYRARGLPRSKHKQKAVLYGAAIALGITASSWAGVEMGNLAIRPGWSKQDWGVFFLLIFVAIAGTTAQQFAYLFIHGELDMHLALCAVEAFSVPFSYVPSLLVLYQMQDVTWVNWGGIAVVHAVQLTAIASMAADP